MNSFRLNEVIVIVGERQCIARHDSPPGAK